VQIDGIRLRRHLGTPPGRVLIQVVPTGQQQLGSETPLQGPTTVMLVNACCVGSAPPGGWLLGVRSDGVRQKCPVRATYSRPVLPPVVGFPPLRGLCVRRHPSGVRWAFPLTVLLHLPVEQESLGLPTFFDVSLPAGHGLRTPADLPILADADGLVLPSGACKPSASALAMSKLYPHVRGRGHPYGLQDALSTLRPSCSPGSGPRLRHGRQTRYGWVANPDPTGTFTR
jgi:hypothetical protein